MPINETRAEIQIDSQTIKQSQLLIKIPQSNHQTVQFLKVVFVKIVFSFRTNYETFPLARFWTYCVSCACVVEGCACQLYIKRIYDDDDDDEFHRLNRDITSTYLMSDIN